MHWYGFLRHDFCSWTCPLRRRTSIRAILEALAWAVLSSVSPLLLSFSVVILVLILLYYWAHFCTFDDCMLHSLFDHVSIPLPADYVFSACFTHIVFISGILAVANRFNFLLFHRFFLSFWTWSSLAYRKPWDPTGEWKNGCLCTLALVACDLLGLLDSYDVTFLVPL